MARPHPLDPEIRTWLRARVEAESVRVVGKALAMSETTIARALADLPLQAGTVALLRQAFEGRKAA